MNSKLEQLKTMTTVVADTGDIDAIQRVEFSSQRRMGKNQRISLQLPKHSESIRDLRAGFFQPSNEK